MANLNMNKVILGGRLTKDPELKMTQSGTQVCSFSIAVNRKPGRAQDGVQQETIADFFDCTAWRQTGENISRFFRKGSSILITGTIQNRNWTDTQGAKHYATGIVVDEFFFVDSKSENPGAGSAPAQQQYTPNNYSAPAFSSQADAPKFEEMSNDDDLPF